MNLTPRDIVAALDRHIIGQDQAKRAVAVAVRNRWRRRQLDPDLAREVAPKNIVMVGPTGVGKTEIARRLADLADAPFIKVEATKYTEVGYHGRDVESMIRDLLELGIQQVRSEHARNVREQAEGQVEERLVSILLGDSGPPAPAYAAAAATTMGAHGGARDDDIIDVGDDDGDDGDSSGPAAADRPDPHAVARARMLDKLRAGKLEDAEVEISVTERQSMPLLGMMGPDQFDPGVTSMLENLMPDRRRRRRVTVRRARDILVEEITDQLVDDEKIIEQAIERTEETGIVFLDEIDKIASGDGKSADVSRQGVQRDLLPIVEGSAVSTRHGVVRTDQILFIAAGAFHSSAVSDLMPELQGRFPIRVTLDALTREDFKRILTEPDASLTRQQAALLGAEGLEVTFDEGAIDAMADLAAEANAHLENIGARRLMTVIEQVFEEVSFDAPERAARGDLAVHVTEAFVRDRVGEVVDDEDLRRFVL